MSMMVSFVLSFFPRDVLDEILNLIESVSEDFLTTLTSELTEVKQTAYEKVKLFLIAHITDNWVSDHKPNN